MTSTEIIQFTIEGIKSSGLKPSLKAEQYIAKRYKIDDPEGKKGGFSSWWKEVSYEDAIKRRNK